MYGRGRGLAEDKRHTSFNSPIGTIQNSRMRPLKAGVIYFLLVFALGWVLGPIRELWAVPRFGRIAALLVEAVIMLIAMVVSSRWVIRRFNVPQTLSSTIPNGSGGARNIGTRRDRRCPLGTRVIPTGISC